MAISTGLRRNRRNSRSMMAQVRCIKSSVVLGTYAERSGDFADRSGGFADRSGGFADRSGDFADRSGGFAARSNEQRESPERSPSAPKTIIVSLQNDHR